MAPERTREFPENYDYFDNRHERADIYTFCKGLAEYLKNQEVRNIVFVDRSARPAWIGVDEYWKRNFQGIPKPGFYFINPDGFNPQLVGVPEIQSNEALKYLVKSINIPLLSISGKEEDDIVQEIADRFEEVFVGLRHDKDKPLVLFDTCSHTGGTIENILAVLDAAGFEDVRVITANSPDPSSGVVPAAKIDKYTRLTSCYPFGRDEVVVKGTDVTSKRTRNTRELLMGNVLRKEIRRIVASMGR